MILKFIFTMVTFLTFVSCAPNATQLKKTLKEDPSIIFNVIEENPEKFMDILDKVAKGSQKNQQQKAFEDEQKIREQEFANPLKPVIQPNRVVFGDVNAPVTIVEYSDFECPYCSRSFDTVKQILKEYSGKVKVIFKHLPLDFHPSAMPAAKMFEAIARQDHKKAEKFHDLLFKNQDKLKSQGQVFLNKLAKNVGADLKKITTDLNSPEIKSRIDADTEEARKFGISGTPGFIVNGVTVKGAYPFDEFKKIIDRHLAKK